MELAALIEAMGSSPLSFICSLFFILVGIPCLTAIVCFVLISILYGLQLLLDFIIALCGKKGKWTEIENLQPPAILNEHKPVTEQDNDNKEEQKNE